MKISFLSLLLLFLITSCFTATASAREPISGVEVRFGKSPGGPFIPITKTDKNGSFTISVKEGNYSLTISYADVVKAMQGVKGFDPAAITLTYANSDIKTLVPMIEKITAHSGPIIITTHSKNATISGTLTYEPKSGKAVPHTKVHNSHAAQ
jgi:hypothetical protein